MVWFSAWAVYGSMCSRLNLSDDNDWPLCFMATHCIQHKSMHWGITVPEEMKVVIVAGHKRGIISVIIFWEWFSMEVICLMYSLWIAVYDIDLWWFYFLCECMHVIHILVFLFVIACWRNTDAKYWNPPTVCVLQLPQNCFWMYILVKN